MRVIVVKPYKTYGVGVELNVTYELIKKNPNTFKPIVQVKSLIAPHKTDDTAEEE